MKRKALSRTFAVMAGLLSFCHIGAQEIPDWKKIVPIDNVRGTKVIFAFGQSNAANHGQSRYNPVGKVYNYHKGTLFTGEDPIIGASGMGGSVWTRLADKMISHGMADSVTVISIAIGATDIASWADGGVYRQHFVENVDRMLQDGIVPDYILWHQGESDNIAGTDALTYSKRFETIRRVFRDRGINAPILIAYVSYHPDCIKTGKGINKEIRKAQKGLTKQYEDIFPGADTDRLDKCYQRHDGVHFSEIGLEEHAKLWFKALKKVGKK